MHGLLDDRRYLIPFRSQLLPNIFTGTLVIGGGVAGLRAALAAAEGGDVILLAKRGLDLSNTAWAQGGIAAVLDPEDTVEAHVRDTLVAGAGLCDEAVVRSILEEGPHRVGELLDWGMDADREADGSVRAGREGGHTFSRIVHAGGDATGAAIVRVLTERVLAHPKIRVFTDCFALDLVTPSEEPGAPVLGAITHHSKYGLQMLWAKTTVLATGGAGSVFRETTNPKIATADGFAMAYRAGASVADMEFVQFHPTVLYLAGAARSLISEAVRGEGATLLDSGMRRFMVDEHELAELAPRDVVSRAIVRRIAATGSSHVWLDARGLESFSERFPGITAQLAKYGLDPTSDLIPVHPAAHYMVGGVRTDGFGGTGVPGLLAVGEVACTGLHGANRLASNSLLEGLVVGARAGEFAADIARENGLPAPVGLISDIRPRDHGELDLVDVRSSLRSAMWRNVGVSRVGGQGGKLAEACEMLDFWARYTLDKIFDEPQAWETQNLLMVGSLIARAALWREETRGCHTREDAPAASDELLCRFVWRRGESSPERESVCPEPVGI